ncbi:MAG: hypothetical protein WC855_03135 [Thermodesulfovibrionales bacterium]
MAQQKLLLSAIHLCFVLSLIGCVHSTVQIHDAGALPANERVTLVTDSKDVTIERVDQKKVTTLRQLWDKKWDAEVQLEPGEHEIEAKYWNGPTFKQHIESRYLFSLKGAAGHTYQIRHRVSERSAKVWIEDATSGQRVGRVIASQNESVDEPAEVFDHSVYFTMTQPEESGWIIPNRNSGSINFGKQGSGIDETYAVYIQLVELPKLATRDDFIEYVKAGRGKDLDRNRFTIVRDDIAYYEEREDYCISYHSISEDKNAHKQSNNKDPMLLEMIGFFCRQPQNKNIGIVFDYSHRYYAGHQDEKLPEKARITFEKLKF